MGAISNAGGDFGGTKIPIIGGFFSDPNDRAKVQNLQDMSTQYQWRRPMQAEASMNALKNRAQMYGGAQDALASMYGPKEAQKPSMMDPGRNLTTGPGGVTSLYKQGNLNPADASGQAAPGNPYGDQFGFSGAGQDRAEEKWWKKGAL